MLPTGRTSSSTSQSAGKASSTSTTSSPQSELFTPPSSRVYTLWCLPRNSKVRPDFLRGSTHRGRQRCAGHQHVPLPHQGRAGEGRVLGAAAVPSASATITAVLHVALSTVFVLMVSPPAASTALPSASSPAPLVSQPHSAALLLDAPAASRIEQPGGTSGASGERRRSR